MVDKDPTGVDDKLSWLRRCGEAHGACFLIQPQLYTDMMLLHASKPYPFLVRSSQVRQSPIFSSVSSKVVITKPTFFKKLPLLKPQYL